jgi:hypothetical protein
MKVFSTPAISFKVDQVDEEKGILSKVIVAQIGTVKSHFESIDQTTLSQIVQFGNLKENGIKARFGHPNMCSSSFGTYIGRFKNFQIVSDSVCADLHLDPVCKDCPSGNLYNYIITMAKNNPDMFGASIAFVPAQSETSEEAEYPVTRIQELLATDLVDDPAATNSLFAVDSFSYQATAFLDSNPAIAWLIANKPETIVEFMLKYFSNNNLMKKEMFQKLRNLFSGSTTETNENAKQEVLNIEKYFDDMAGRIGETYADILENLRKTPIKINRVEGFDNTPAGSEAILDKILIKDELTVENMFDDVKSIIFGQSTLAAEIISYFNSVIEKLQQDHQTQLSSIQDQVTSLQDQLKAGPTTVEGIDPQLQIATAEESFGKQLLHQMPKVLKEKIKK